MTTKPRVRNRAFTLIEVVVFVALFTVSIVLIFASVNYAGLGLKNAQYKIMASHASEELSEWLKYQNESQGYPSILSRASVGGTTYCFNSTEIVWPAVGSCTTFSLNNFFRRELLLSRAADNSELTATVTTSWNSVGFVRSSQIVSLLTNH
ncbi:MAG: hypothetical protein WC775_00925 [Patescibacteria group bacterium]